MLRSRTQAYLFVIWLALGLLLAAILLVAWLRNATLSAWLADLQAWYGVAPPYAWWQRTDSHLHLGCSLLLTCWWALSLHLFTRITPVAALALAVLTALSDELCQLFSGERTFEWSDQFADATGILLALPVIWWLRRR
jgi:VanZ family protein